MPLLKNKIAVPFAAGLETKTDDSQDQLGGLRVLENVIFDTPKKLLKRRGYSILDTKLLDNSEITNAKFLANFSDELGLLTNTDYYAYAESINKWTDKGRVFTAYPSSKPILRNNREQKNIDIISVEGINAYVYEDSSGVRLSVIDNANCNFLLSDELLSASGSVPRVCNIENTIYVFYADSTDIKYRTVNILNPENITTEQTFTSDLESTDKNFDCVDINNKIYIAYNSSSAGGQLSIKTIDSSNVISSTVGVTGEDASTALNIEKDCGSRLLISYYNGSDVKVVVYNSNLGTQLVPVTVIETIADVKNVSIIESDLSNNTYTLFYEVSDTSVKDHFIKKNTIDLTATVGTPSIIKRSVGIASKSFMQDNEVYFTAVHESALQSTYFILNSSGTIVSKFSSNLGGDIPSENVLSKVESLGDSKFVVGTQIKGRTVVDDDQFFSLLGVNSVTLDFDPNDPLKNEELGSNLHIAGGFLMMYDGDKVVEHGFHIFPEDLVEGSTSTVGGSIGDGEYQYAAVYTWTDNKGQIHRSAPSIGLSVTLSGL